MSISKALGLKMNSKLEDIRSFKASNPELPYPNIIPVDFSLDTAAIELTDTPIASVDEPGVGQSMQGLGAAMEEMNKPLFAILGVVGKIKKFPDYLTPEQATDLAELVKDVKAAQEKVQKVIPPTASTIVELLATPLTDNMPAYSIKVKDPVKVFKADPTGLSVDTPDTLKAKEAIEAQLEEAKASGDNELVTTLEKLIEELNAGATKVVKFILGILLIPFNVIIGTPEKPGILMKIYNWVVGLLEAVASLDVSKVKKLISELVEFITNVAKKIIDFVIEIVSAVFSAFSGLMPDELAGVICGAVECVMAVVLLPFSMAGFI